MFPKSSDNKIKPFTIFEIYIWLYDKTILTMFYDSVVLQYKIIEIQFSEIGPHIVFGI